MFFILSLTVFSLVIYPSILPLDLKASYSQVLSPLYCPAPDQAEGGFLNFGRVEWF